MQDVKHGGAEHHPSWEEHSAGHEPAPHAAGHGHKKHARGHGDDQGHAGGHGGNWIVTYCDMITLLIACFICIITFASKEPEKYSKKRDSILYGPGGEGFAGREQSTLDRDSVVWRQRPISARTAVTGSEIPPRYSDPVLEATAEILRRLEGPTLGTSGDPYVMRVPLATLFETDKRLSSTGMLLLRAMGRNLRALPYEVYFQLNDSRRVPQGVTMAQYLMDNCGIHPSRLAVGMGDTGEPWQAVVSITFACRP